MSVNFSDYGMFNVTAYALNFVTEVETWHELMVIVTSAPCAPPDVTIPLNSTASLAPLKFKMSEAVVIGTLAITNCSDVLSTKKTWTISKAVVNVSNLYEELTDLDITEIAPDTMSKAELIIPARMLEYGTYKVRFFSRMWDERDEDPMWTRKLPFERDAYTYIEIIPSDLVARLTDSTANLVTRGQGQSLLLEPYFFSYDPDYPLLKDEGFEYYWFCRMMSSPQSGEEYPTDPDGNRHYNESNLLTIPFSKPDNGSTGCFGTGPGAINVTGGIAKFETTSFHSVEQLYEILLEVRKDTSNYKPGFVRITTKIIHLKIVEGVPPLMKILCADPALCFSDSSGKTYINPSSRLALKAWCSLDEGSDCSEPMKYKWIVSLPADMDTLLDKVEENSPTGLENIEVAVSSNLFFEYPNEEIFYLGLTATNSFGTVGQTVLYLYLNKLPFGGSCTVSPTYGISMLDDFFLSCENWSDPENAGIAYYLVSSKSNGQEASLARVSYFDPKEPLKLSLATGVHDIMVTIEDDWGGQTLFTLPDQVVVDPIDAGDFDSFMKSGKLDELVGSGDKGAMLMVLQAQAQVLADSDELLLTEEPLVDVPGLELSPEEEEFNKAVVKGQIKIDSLNMLSSTGAAITTDLPTAEIVAKTVETLIGEPALPGEKGDIGLEATQSAADVLQGLADSLGTMDGIADPAQIIPAMTSMTSTIGTLLDGIMGTSNIKTAENSTADEICPQLIPIDTVSADKPGVVDYDTDVGDDIDMQVPQDPMAQRCGGIVDAAKLTGQRVGQQLLDMLSQMSRTLLAKSVVNEEQLIETESVSIYAKL